MKTQIKKLLSILTLVAILATAFYTVPTTADTYDYDRFITLSKDGNWGYVDFDDYFYDINEDNTNKEKIIIVDYRGNETEVVIPETIDGHTVVGVADFYDEDELVSKLFDDDSNITKVTLPKTIKKLSECFYQDDYDDSEDTYWDEYNEIVNGRPSWGKESITEYLVDENNPYFSSEDGIIYNKDKTELVLYPAGKTDEVFTLPESVKSFGEYAFANSKLKRVENFNQIKKLSNYLFMNSNLEEFPKMENLQEIEDGAFACCNNLKNVTIHSKVDIVGCYAFYSCENLKEVDFGKIIMIGDGAFCGCSSLEKVVLPKTCTVIAESAFRICDNLTDLVIPHVEAIGDYAFSYCRSLKNIKSKYNDKENILYADNIWLGAFAYCYSLENLTIRTEEIWSDAFKDCTALQDISFYYTFDYKYLPDYIKSDAFDNTAYVNNHKDGIVYIDDVALCYKKPAKPATYIKIKDGTEHIAEGCLYDIDDVKSLYLPSSLLRVEDDNIVDMKDLKHVYIDGKNTKFHYNSCERSKKITYYVKSKAYEVLKHFDDNYYHYQYNYTTDWKPDKTKSVSAVGKTKSTAKITWKKQGYVSGYEVYMKTSKNGKWKKVATLKGSDSTSYTQKGLSKNKTYYFRVRAYKTVYNKTYYGAYSTTDAAKTKKK